MVAYGYQSIQAVLFGNVVDKLREIVKESPVNGQSAVETVLKCLPSVEDLQGEISRCRFFIVNIFNLCGFIDLVLSYVFVFWRSDQEDTPVIVTERTQVNRYCR